MIDQTIPAGLAAWLVPPEPPIGPAIVLYRNEFTLAHNTEFKLKFSASEYADLYLDGEWVAEGPERGDNRHRFFAEYAATLNPGRHVLVARVLFAPGEASVSGFPGDGFGFAAESDSLTEPWSCRIPERIELAGAFPDWGGSPRVQIASGFDWSCLQGGGGGWLPAVTTSFPLPAEPPWLPPMRREPEPGYRLHREPGRLLVIFDNYVCVRAEYVFRGPGRVETRWAESLYDTPEFDRVHLTGPKGNRSEFRGKHFIGAANNYELPGGECRWRELRWKAGRYLEIRLAGGAELAELRFERTGYPYVREWRADTDLPELNRTLELAWRTLECCSADTLMDCPFYERLQYIADSRLEALTGFVSTTDDRLFRKALRMFADSQQPDGLLFTRWPSRQIQVIPSFLLHYVIFLHEFASWRGTGKVQEFLPAARGVFGWLARHTSDGLLAFPGWHDVTSGTEWNDSKKGWNFIDWCENWNYGVPPDESILNLLYLLAQKKMAELEAACGFREHADFYREEAAATASRVKAAYPLRAATEHAAALAVLAGLCPPEEFELTPGMTPAGISFSHHILEAAYLAGRGDLFHRRLEAWYGFPANGLKTLPENFGTPRSDCHAWSSHVLYHYFSSILGIRPGAIGSNRWNIAPLPGGKIRRASGTMAHPAGAFRVAWEELDDGRLRIDYSVPDGIELAICGEPAENSGRRIVLRKQPVP